MHWLKSVLLWLMLAGLSYSQDCNETLEYDYNNETGFDPAVLNAAIATKGQGTCNEFFDLLVKFIVDPTNTIVELTGPITMAPQNGIRFRVTFASNNSRKVVLTLKSGTDNSIIGINVPNIEISNVWLLQKSQSSTHPALNIGSNADSATIKKCHFEIQNSGGLGVRVNAVNTEISQCYFRNYPHTADNTAIPRALDIQNGATGMKIQSCLFYGVGLNIDDAGVTVQANTFAGRLGDSNRVINMENIDQKAFVIRNNLFAMDSFTISPIQVTGTQSGVADQKINNNAFSHTIGTVVTSTFSGQPEKNVQLPRGLSDYNGKDFPLSQMRDDPTLDPYGVNFGQVPLFYRAFSDSISQIKLLTDQEYFEPLAGNIWSDGMLVGCFSSFDAIDIYRPSPISSLDFQVVEDFKTHVKRAVRVYDTSYYAGFKQPERVFWFFSDNPDNLAGNDSASLDIAVNAWNERIYNNDGQTITPPIQSDSILTVPTRFRNGDPVYLKMVHRTQYGWASPSANALDTINGLAKYPISDFKLTTDPDDINLQTGQATVFYAKEAGSREPFKEVKIQAYSILLDSIVADTVINTDLNSNQKPVEFVTLPKGKTYFRAFPIGTSGTQDITGTDTIKTDTVDMRALSKNQAYFEPTKQCDKISGTGLKNTPFCSLEEVKEWYGKLTQDTATIIVMQANSGADTLQNPIAQLGGDKRVILMSHPFSASSVPERKKPRPVIKGLTLDRPGVEVKGFFLLKPADKPAVAITSGGVSLESNFILSASPGEQVKISSTDSTQTVIFKNNFFYGGTQAFQIQSPVGLLVLNNSFVDADETNNTIAFDFAGINAALSSGLNVIIANNHFSGNGPEKTYKAPFRMPAGVNLAAQITMVRNVFSTSLDSAALSGVIRKDTLAYSRSVINVDPWDSDLLGKVESYFQEAMALNTDRVSPLYAGSDTIYKAAKDIWGNLRIGKAEVGAFENRSVNNYSSLTASVETVNELADSLTFAITSKNYETGLSPFVLVWWYEGKLCDKSISAYPIDSAISSLKLNTESLESGYPPAIRQYAGGINGLGKSGGKWFTVFISFSDTSGSNPLNPQCREQITGTPITATECLNPADGKKCPEGNIWTINHPDFPSSSLEVELEYVSTDIRILATGGTVTSGIQSTVPKLTLASLPYISVDSQVQFKAKDPANEENNFYKLTVHFQKQVDFSGLYLFRKAWENDKIYFVYSWSHSAVGDLSKAVIESREPGMFLFGKVNPQLGTPLSVSPLMPGGNYESGISATVLGYTSTPSITANPIIMITPVPAGAVMKDSVFQKDYFARAHIISSEFASMGKSLKNRQLSSLYDFLLNHFSTISIPPELGRAPIKLPENKTVFIENVNVKEASADNRIQFEMEEYKKPYTKRKVTRSLEFIYTIFDAGKMAMSNTFWRTKFTSDLERGNTGQYDFSDLIQLKTKTWELFAYPWAEEETTKTNLFSILGLNNINEWKANRHRLFQSLGSNNGTGERWAEYEGKEPKTISIDSGRAVWVATYGNGPEVLGFQPKSNGGQSLDYQPFKLALAAGQWNDFGLPYNFPMKLKDLLVASNLPQNSSIFQFNPLYQNSDTPAYTPLDSLATLYPWRGYTVKPEAESELVFPIIDYQRSHWAESPAKKVPAKKGYEIKILAHNETGASQLTVGKSQISTFIGEAPRLPLQNFSISLIRLGSGSKVGVFSGLKGPLSEGLPGAWQFQTRFSTHPSTISFSIRKSNNLPDTMGVFLVNPLEKRIVDLKVDKNVKLPATTLESGGYHIVAGSRAFAQSLTINDLLRLANFPNPFNSRTKFQIVLPTSGISYPAPQYQIKILNLKGETVYSFSGSFKLGKSRATHDWDGKNTQGQVIPAGPYLALLNVKIAGKKLTTKQKLVKLH